LTQYEVRTQVPEALVYHARRNDGPMVWIYNGDESFP